MASHCTATAAAAIVHSSPGIGAFDCEASAKVFQNNCLIKRLIRVSALLSVPPHYIIFLVFSLNNLRAFLTMCSTAAMDSSDSQNILSENKVMNYQSDNGFVAEHASCGVDGESCRSVAKNAKQNV